MRLRKNLSAIAATALSATLLFVIPSESVASDSGKQVPMVSIPKVSALESNSAGVKDSIKLAREYVASSEQAWNARITAAQNEAIAAKREAESEEAKREYKAAQEKAARLTTVANEKHEESAAWAREALRDPTSNYSPSLLAFLAGPEDASDVTDDIQRLTSIQDRRDQELAEAVESKERAEQAEAAAEKLSEESDRLYAEAQEKLEIAEKSKSEQESLYRDSRRKFAEASTVLNNAEIDAGVKSSTPASQRVLMMASVENWNEYVESLHQENPVLPRPELIAATANDQGAGTSNRAEEIASRKGRNLPELIPAAVVENIPVEEETSLAHTTENKPQIGAVTTKLGTLVLSQKSLDRATQALNALGTPYQKLQCQDLASQAFGFKKSKTLEKLFVSGHQNAKVEDTLPGDVVFFEDEHGLSQAGISVGQGLVVLSSSLAGSVIIAPIDATAVKSVRPGIEFDKDSLDSAPKKKKRSDGIDWQCGGIATSGSVSSNGSGMESWVLPFGDRDYKLGLDYGEKSKSGKKSKGVQFLSSKPDVVQAALPGSISVEGTKKDGFAVTVEHSDSISVRYSGVKSPSVLDGGYVNAGDPVGVSSNMGPNQGAKTPGVLVEAMVANTQVDPNIMFFPPALENDGEGKLGGYENGHIPTEELCSIGKGQMLRCDAAVAYKEMDAAYKKEFGRSISITDSYRSYEAQVRVKATKGHLAATPGTSNHGWGLALDLGDGINNFGTAQYAWMLKNAPTFGWDNPAWARAGGSKPEAWHWEYVVGMG